MWRCENCGTENSGNAKYCIRCGKLIPEGAKFCIHCGTGQSGTAETPAEQTEPVSAETPDPAETAEKPLE